MSKLKQVAFGERRHPCWDLGIVSDGEKQQIPDHFPLAERRISLSPAFPKTIQLPLSEKAYLNLDDGAFSQISHCPPPPSVFCLFSAGLPAEIEGI